jgi:hypothetical protein
MHIAAQRQQHKANPGAVFDEKIVKFHDSLLRGAKIVMNLEFRVMNYE